MILNTANMNIDRRDFMLSAAAFAAVAPGAAAAQSREPTGDAELDARQREVDAITPAEFAAYWHPGTSLAPEALAAAAAAYPVLGRLEAAFDKVVREVRETAVADASRPAVWYVYNMGLVVKTPKTLFAVDLHHRRAEELAPMLDFALITHNHDDHYTERFKVAMDRGQRKSVVNNFFDNYGVADRKFGGYTRENGKTFDFGDVRIVANLCDHNSYLIDYTTAFEIQVGDYTIFHSGDCCSRAKLRPSRRPDLWVLHPKCGMDAAEACAAIMPKTAVVAHLQEMGHARGRYRWTYRDGLDVKAKIEAAGFEAVMPLWGDRIA